MWRVVPIFLFLLPNFATAKGELILECPEVSVSSSDGKKTVLEGITFHLFKKDLETYEAVYRLSPDGPLHLSDVLAFEQDGPQAENVRKAFNLDASVQSAVQYNLEDAGEGFRTLTLVDFKDAEQKSVAQYVILDWIIASCSGSKVR